MIVTIDTNVIMSGIFWSGPPSSILDLWEAKKFELALTPEIIGEYYEIADIMGKKLKSYTANQVIDLIVANSKIYEAAPLKEQMCTDPHDDKFIACAFSSKSEFIVTGDKALLKVDLNKKPPIIKAKTFLEIL